MISSTLKPLSPHTMIRAFTLSTLAAPAIVYAQNAQFGTAAEARAMLDRAAVSMKADPAKTIAQINKGEGGFRDRDLYVFCLANGKVVAHGGFPERVGLLQKDLRDAVGKPYGEEFARVAEEGEVAEVSYTLPRPGPDKTPAQKISFVTKVADHVCGVGYYK